MTEQEQTGTTATTPDVGAPVTQAASPNRHWLGYAISLVLFLLAGGIAFWLYQLRTHQEGLGSELSKEDQEISELNTQMAVLQDGFKTLHGQFASLETRVTTQDSQVERLLGEQSTQLNARIDQTRADLGASLEHVQQVLGKTRTDWLLADAEFLLGAAAQRLYLTGDAGTTLAAMEAADERLKENADPAVFKVREVLADEIRLLKEFTPPDLIGLSARLLALEEKVRALPLHLPHAAPAAGPVDVAEQNPGQPTVLNDALRELRGLVTIRRTDKPVGSVLSPEEAALLKEILLLKLEMARMALVRGDETLFQSSVTSARAWLAEHFGLDRPAVREMDANLKVLGEQGLKVVYPQIGKALALLRDTAKFRARPAKAPAAAASQGPVAKAVAPQPAEAGKPVEAGKPAP